MTLHKCMPRGVIVKKYLLSLILMLPLSIFVVAQDNEAEDEVEEVVVTGIKKSLISAIDIKRNNVGVVDAITAEDFGKFPDNNLAESLARVVGIGIDRSNVEGERVAVRGFGPELNLVTLNGRQMPTVPGQWGGGRSFNFGDISSHGISAVEVYKSTNSSLPSGGIGSTINMVTTKPLSINGSLNSFSVRGRVILAVRVIGKQKFFSIFNDFKNPLVQNIIFFALIWFFSNWHSILFETFFQFNNSVFSYNSTLSGKVPIIDLANLAGFKSIPPFV